MPDPHETRSAHGGRGATVLGVVTVVLAVGATGAMVLGDDTRILRLGLVGALWATVLAGFAVTGLRKRLADKDAREVDLKRVYELELEREVAARREFEAEAETAARRTAAAESREELDALRAELAKLRGTLEQIVGGDMLVERVALHAESTRVRSWGEHEGPPARVTRPADPWGAQLSPGAAEYGYGDYAHSGHVQYAQYGGDPTPGVNGAGSAPHGGYPVNGVRPAQAPPPGVDHGVGEAHTDLISPVPGNAASDGPSPTPDTLRDSARPAVVRSGPPPQSEVTGEWPAATGEAAEPESAPPESAEPQGSPGAHAQGKSVSELLAAFGGGRASKRRRRQG
ncbi:hypothetical protein GIY23_01635 [Allosaccharopolyspora coralli]|uniref:DUF6779 domain-containing protein n=1 Tax=Allosaccharopolyspora coralli TaxID=2665642 RepID=A0A5Q3Q4K0_9PSEU|nr:DUF6779 domain-containing protein [Allosaccharopolyspora coralli]QGK68426.1 hypothetical protein GIY23_01635 [Allosaccharopolyspora coralli]